MFWILRKPYALRMIHLIFLYSSLKAAILLWPPHHTNGIGIVVHNDSDILVPFLVAGFINADVHKTPKSAGTLCLNSIERAVYTVADRYYRDLKIEGHSNVGGKPLTFFM